VLAMLLMRHGEVVTRDEVQKKLWPADTFVNFDHRLNKAINKARDALGDSESLRLCGNCVSSRLWLYRGGQSR
jgi:DNA-binding winged helix-turn-helix (wHTH) protein